MNKGKRSTANREREVNALAGVRSPPSKVNIPNEITVTTTGVLFSINPFHCKTRERVSKMKNIAWTWSQYFNIFHREDPSRILSS